MNEELSVRDIAAEVAGRLCQGLGATMSDALAHNVARRALLIACDIVAATPIDGPVSVPPWAGEGNG